MEVRAPSSTVSRPITGHSRASARLPIPAARSYWSQSDLAIAKPVGFGRKADNAVLTRTDAGTGLNCRSGLARCRQ